MAPPAVSVASTPKSPSAGKSSKKRQSSSSSSTKQKKVKTTSIRVEVSPNNPEYDPIVVSFPRGVPSSIINNNTDDNDESNNNISNNNNPPRFTCSKLKSSSSRGKKVSGSDDNCTYTASAAGRGHDDRLTKTYVCVYNKKSKTLKLVPSAEKGTVFALEQSVKEYKPNVANESMLFGGGQMPDGKGGTKVMSASDRVQMLVESFGSKKKQKVMASRESNKVNIHSVVGAGELMMRSVSGQEGISAENKRGMEAGSKMLNPNEAAYESARRRMLPPYDIDADAPVKVYNAQTIAGPAWLKISRIVDKVLEKKTEQGDDDEEEESADWTTDWTTALVGTKGYRPQSIVALFKTINPAKKGSAYRIKVAFFLFLTAKFHGKIQRRNTIEGTSLDDCISALNMPHEVGLRLFDLFTTPIDGTGAGYMVSKQQKTKLHAYILVLYVIASGKEMKVPSINMLGKDLKLDDKEASLLLREAGFVVKKNGAGDVGASLSVPLKFPPPKRGKKS